MARLVEKYKRAKPKFWLGLLSSQLEPAREQLASRNEPTIKSLAGPAAQLRLDESETLSLPLRLSQSHTPTPTSARRLGDSRVPSPPPTSPRHLARPVVPGSPARPSNDPPPGAGALPCGLAAGAPARGAPRGRGPAPLRPRPPLDLLGSTKAPPAAGPLSPQPWRKTLDIFLLRHHPAAMEASGSASASWLGFFSSWLVSQTSQLELPNEPSRA